MAFLSPSRRHWFQSLARSAVAGGDGRARVGARQIYILPTRYGLLYAGMLLAMLFGANNYGSNPGFLLTFLFAGLGMAALFQTWKNLLGLEVAIRPGDPVFQGNRAEYVATVFNTHLHQRAGLQVYATGNRSGQGSADIPAQASDNIVFYRNTVSRGWLTSGRVALETRFPLGLFRAWCYVDTDASVLVYPAPAEHADGLRQAGRARHRNRARQSGDDDFAGHRPYQRGDTAMHVDWKALARGRGWHVKQFDAPGGEELWLDWDTVSVAGTEKRLSALTRAVLDLDRAGLSWGLDLPGNVLPVNSGRGHRNQCLRALALFDGNATGPGDGR